MLALVHVSTSGFSPSFPGSGQRGLGGEGEGRALLGVLGALVLVPPNTHVHSRHSPPSLKTPAEFQLEALGPPAGKPRADPSLSLL